MNTNPTQLTSLEAQLIAKKESFSASAPQDLQDLFDKGVSDLAETGILEKAKNIGDSAPNFTLKNQNDEPLTLNDSLESGPVVLTWYRGGWCPYCNLTLSALQQALPELQKHNATLLALTPETPDNSMSTAEKNELEFQVLSDLDNQVAKQYGVMFKLPGYLAESYKQFFDLTAYNGNDKNELPLAATYVIDKNGVIQYAYLNADYRKRAEPADIIKALEALN